MRPWFFEHLAIVPTRDVAQIKRAYATGLKLIDPLHQRVAFETLRRAYEQALDWTVQPALVVLPHEWDDDEEETRSSSSRHRQFSQ